ncbi:MAG TPA: hypothetical protein PLK63_03080 [Catalimonadaceae bacterium]|nr:hypothetical protein [Catalimonadaceae bacterium]
MKRLISLVLVFAVSLVILILLVVEATSYWVDRRNFKNSETESNLLVMRNDSSYDLVFLGISHARNFSRHRNHERIESILNQKILNMGQGGGICGPNEQLFYLQYFYSQGNKAKKIVYVLSPPFMFSVSLPIASNTFNYEPFRIPFVWQYLNFPAENRSERLMSMIQFKLTPTWINHIPFSYPIGTSRLEKLDSATVAKGQELAFNSGSEDMKRFAFSADILQQTIDLARSHGTEVVLFIPPALFGKWRGHEITKKFGEKVALQKGVSFYDFSETEFDPKFYYDHHHLNTYGVVHFTEKFLKPVLQ